MAIYHFSAKMISRASGSSALAAAAYRSASRLHDERLDRHHDFSKLYLQSLKKRAPSIFLVGWRLLVEHVW